MSDQPSETSIANAALVLLGERRINSLDEKTKTAKILSEKFADTRDELLRNHSWNFATRRASLAADSEAPVWGYANQFTLPDQCLRVLEVGNNTATTGYRRGERQSYTIEGRKVVTDIGAPLLIEYAIRVTDPIEMDVMFRQVLAAALARDCAEAITGSSEKYQEMSKLYVDKLRVAKGTDGQEPSPRRIEASEFLHSREESWLGRDIPTGTGTPL